MQTFDTATLGIERGSLLVFSDFEEGGPMWTGDGPREVRQHVAFSRAFRTAPQILVTPEMWDVAEGANLRLDVSHTAAAPDGFEVVVRTWGDTRVARVRVGWIAFGPASHPDDWDV